MIEKKEKDYGVITIVISMIMFTALIISLIYTENKKIEKNYEIEMKKIENGIYERKEVNLNIERNEEPN